ncbi:MAG: hypothetical protein GOMPHAMPRED_004050 [Gomphillus americanus]|uniref:HhH-GPD domain-containing protein n=1 Tax=Gomphillus americanus TaxID=1940652 RepID=A0A8H3FMG4_9LECA|nr:MAG: hypothetical protein GOMPHAMPRED_004050 [Gomphillus americanus]
MAEKTSSSSKGKERATAPLPHGLSASLPLSGGSSGFSYASSSFTPINPPNGKPEVSANNERSNFTTVPTDSEDTNDELEDTPEVPAIAKSKKKSLLTVRVTYCLGVKLGVSPFPNFERPTLEECHHIHQLLEQEHGQIVIPEVPDMPSTTVAGCGNVPFVLEALIRTVISQNTTMAQANTAIANVVNTFGLIVDGPYSGTIDWNKVRLADPQLLINAIRPAGTQIKKSTHIRSILNEVWKDNLQRRLEIQTWDQEDRFILKREKYHVRSESEQHCAMWMADLSTAILRQKEKEILTLDFLHASTTSDAFERLNKFDGVGVKTAACVLLFCMQRPVFAVDTHVWRLCRWLKWVPTQQVSANNTFAHCDARVPDELKYSLHQLMILHGQTCKRCNAKDISTHNDPTCILEGHLRRHRFKNETERRTSVEIEEYEEDEDDDDIILSSIRKNRMFKKRRASTESTDTVITSKAPKLSLETPLVPGLSADDVDDEEDEPSSCLSAAPFESNSDDHISNDKAYDMFLIVCLAVTNNASRSENGKDDEEDIMDEEDEDVGEAEEDDEDMNEDDEEEEAWPAETDNEADSDYQSHSSSDDSQYGRASNNFNTDLRELYQ